MFKRKKIPVIIVVDRCKKCAGLGTIRKGIFDRTPVKCKSCNGTGRK